MNTNFRAIEKKLRKAGWKFVRSNGTSHRVYRKAGVSEPVVIPYHSGKDLSMNVISKLEARTGLVLH